jgi:hypothetical protein
VHVTRGRAAACAGIVGATLSACNALTGVGDLSAVDCADGCDGAVPERTELIDGQSPLDGASSLDGATTLDGARPDDGGKPGDGGDGGDAAPRPTFCEGITLYLPFEGSFNGRSGQPPNSAPGLSFIAGKYGQGADLTGAGGAAIYYASSYLGTPIYSLAHGSVAMWVKPTFAPPTLQAALFFKPRAVATAGAPNAGPELQFGALLLELVVNAPDGGVTKVGYPQTALPNWNVMGWNHLVGTWSGTSPTLQLALNGAAPTSTSSPWDPDESPVNFLRLGSEVSAPRSVFDEVVLWTRVISASEIAAVAASPVSIGVACGL